MLRLHPPDALCCQIHHAHNPTIHGECESLLILTDRYLRVSFSEKAVDMSRAHASFASPSFSPTLITDNAFTFDWTSCGVSKLNNFTCNRSLSIIYIHEKRDPEKRPHSQNSRKLPIRDRSHHCSARQKLPTRLRSRVLE
jgi:hypothetical protein